MNKSKFWEVHQNKVLALVALAFAVLGTILGGDGNILLVFLPLAVFLMTSKKKWLY